MKALLLKEKEDMSIQETEKPVIQPEEVLIEVKYCGICGTDVHIFHGKPGSAEVTPPIVLGHEFSGEVVEIGASVSRLKLGDHVAVDPNIYCGKCTYCRQGRVQLCEDLSAVGVTRNGGMEQFCAVPETACHLLDKELPLEVGALAEPLSCVLHGFHQISEIQARTKVLIIGGGFIGSLFLQTVQLKNPAKVDVCEIDVNKHAQLSELGADHLFQSTDDVAAEYDLVIECIGKKQTIEAGIHKTGKGGEVLLFGVPSPETLVEFPAFDVFSKELKMAGSFINPFTVEEAVSLLNQQKVQVTPLISHTLRLEEVPAVLGNYGDYGITKAIVKL
ncbi:alcohol dehydrogenase [Oceanobacillus oncorhynchi subsp. incaldanensis]|uniref:zinc-dependent alcohol dehydrogenase family protein n=1 Tax=Oceanobacillus oncorhynchi TaxID=545501 RepID=UPI001B277BF7|nr:zinc-dependent alcohol dehydrogenase family protein [Oceanobacillus oncorhynchi]GIO20390.1 alcohol dehydrogenase [Oceanobacillus oncorhynchi subsp. incaldanensis]